MSLVDLTDEALMARVQEGDSASYDVLFQRHQGALYGFLLRRSRNPESSAELFQETWLKVHRGRHTYRPGQPFKPWLFGIAMNAFRDAARRAGRRPLTQELHESHASSATTAERPALRMTLEAAIDQLPDTHREAFLLGAVLGFDHREVALALDISPSNARARISRARSALRTLLVNA